MIHSGPESSAVRQAENKQFIHVHPVQATVTAAEFPLMLCLILPYTFFQLPQNLGSSSLKNSGLCYYTDINQTSPSPHRCEWRGELFAKT